MAISLSKGGNVSLSGSEPGLKKILIGLGWGEGADLDLSAFMLKGDRKVVSEKHFLFYSNLASPDGSVIHSGDDRAGGGSGDNEEIRIDLGMVPSNVVEIAIVATIDDPKGAGLNFGQVRDAYIRVVNDDTANEIARYDLAEDYSIETGVLFGEIYLRDGDWKFRALGKGYAGGLATLCAQYGIDVA